MTGNGASQGYGGWAGFDAPSGGDGPHVVGFVRRSSLGPKFDCEIDIDAHRAANVRLEFERVAVRAGFTKEYSGHTTDNYQPVFGAQHYWIQNYRPRERTIGRQVVLLEVSSLTSPLVQPERFRTNVIVKIQVMYVTPEDPSFIKLKQSIERMLAQFQDRLIKLS
jgi:hypothetical protein